MEYKVLQEKRFSTKKQITKQYYKPHEGDLISFQEVAELIETLQAEAVAQNKQNFKIMVRGLAPDKWTTMKGYSQDFPTDDDYDDYLINKVKDISKFKHFFQVQVTTEENA